MALLLSQTHLEATNWCDDANVLLCAPIEAGSGTTVTDESGNGYDGTINSGGSWETDVSPTYSTYSYHITAYSGNINFGTLGSYDIADTSTVASWFKKPTGASNLSQIFVKGSYRFRCESGFWKFLSKPSGSTQTDVMAGSCSNDTWYHLGLTYDKDASTKLYFYLDGVQTDTSTQGDGDDNTGFDFALMSEGDAIVDDTAVFSDVKTSTDINDMMDNGVLQAAGGGETPNSRFIMITWLPN